MTTLSRVKLKKVLKQAMFFTHLELHVESHYSGFNAQIVAATFQSQGTTVNSVLLKVD